MSETLTRAELAELIYSEVGISKTEASEIVDQFFEEIILDLIDGNSVKLTSFGTFSVKHKKERIGRIDIPTWGDSQGIFFTVSRKEETKTERERIAKT